MKQQDQYYTKFLSAGNPCQNKQKSSSSSKEKTNNNQPIKQFKPDLEPLEDTEPEMILYSDKEPSPSPMPIQEEINEMTYELFINQTKEPLFQTFFKNKQDCFGQKTTPKSRPASSKENKLKYQRKDNVKSSKRREDQINTQKKKKEYYEEIIKTNRDCIRFNPFLVHKEDDRKFEEEQFNEDKAIEIQLDNEVQMRRDLTEKKHKEILIEKIPEIFKRIKMADQNKYFIRNKYSDALNNFS